MNKNQTVFFNYNGGSYIVTDFIRYGWSIWGPWAYVLTSQGEKRLAWFDELEVVSL